MALIPVTIRDTPRGAVLLLRVSAGAARERIVGPHGDRLKIAVREPRERGRANRAALALLARSLGVPRKDLSIASGEASPDKAALFLGVGAEDLRSRLGQALSTRSDP